MGNEIAQFFNHPFFIVVGGIATLISVVVIIYSVTAWALGLIPIITRIGISRWRRKICIVADNDFFSALKSDLISSGIFRKSNIVHVNDNTLANIRNFSVILLHYNSLTEDQIRRILEIKKSEAGLIVYYPEFSPTEGKKIPDPMLALIGNTENTTIVNFRGRLINDVFITFVTTIYA